MELLKYGTGCMEQVTLYGKVGPGHLSWASLIYGNPPNNYMNIIVNSDSVNDIRIFPQYLCRTLLIIKAGSYLKTSS